MAVAVAIVVAVFSGSHQVFSNSFLIVFPYSDRYENNTFNGKGIEVWNYV